MDVERIQKINTLAVDLMRQGLATDREDAVMQAEKIFRNRDSEDYTSLRQTMNKVDAEVKVASASAAGQPQNLSQNQISEILEKNTKFLVCRREV